VAMLANQENSTKKGCKMDLASLSENSLKSFKDLWRGFERGDREKCMVRIYKNNNSKM